MNNIIETRQEDYGNYKETFKRASDNAKNMFDLDLSPATCIKVLIAVKFAREQYKKKEDNIIDALAYIEMLNEMKEGSTKEESKTDDAYPF